MEAPHGDRQRKNLPTSRWKFSLRTMLLVGTVIVLAVSHLVTTKRLKVATDEVQKLRQEVGYLDVADPRRSSGAHFGDHDVEVETAPATWPAILAAYVHGGYTCHRSARLWSMAVKLLGRDHHADSRTSQGPPKPVAAGRHPTGSAMAL